MTRDLRAQLGAAVRAFTWLAVVAVVAALAVRAFAPSPTPPGAEITALVAPRHAVSGQRVAMYLGVRGAREGARAVVRVCRDASCPVDRTEPLSAASGAQWTWMASAALPEGDYRGRVFLQQATPYGHRTVDQSEWRLEVGACAGC